MWTIIERNLKLFFRDKTAMFFSLLSVFIVIFLYLLFLGKQYVAGMDGMDGAKIIVYSQMIGGIIAITSLTATTGALGITVDDKVYNITKDFSVSPIKRSSLAGGYILSSVIIGFILSMVVLVFGEIYIYLIDGDLLTLMQLVQVLGVTIISVLCASSFMFFIISFINSHSAYSILSTIVGVGIGFLTGMYIPITALPKFVRLASVMFPLTHSSSILKGIFLEKPIAYSFKGVPESVVYDFKLDNTAVMEFMGHSISATQSIIYILVVTAVFFGLSMLSISRKKIK